MLHSSFTEMLLFSPRAVLLIGKFNSLLTVFIYVIEGSVSIWNGSMNDRFERFKVFMFVEAVMGITDF